MPPDTRRAIRHITAWVSPLADLIPLYALYALLFADNGMSNADISALFAIWSIVGIAAEVPSGVLADRYSRKSSLVVGGLLHAAGYVVWLAAPNFAGYAAGFALWGVGGSFVSGALEALVYDSLAMGGAQQRYAEVFGRITALGLVAQVVAAVAATPLYAVGGFRLVGLVSIGSCLAGAMVAARLPEPPRTGHEDADQTDERGYLATLRAGLRDAAATSAMRSAIIAVALLSGVDAFEEYIPLLARDWGVSTTITPLATLGIPLVAALGAVSAGRADRLRASSLGVLLALGGAVLVVAAVLAKPAGLVAVTVFYGLYRVVWVVAGARLQHRIESSARATVTSVAGFGTEFAALLLFGAWAIGGLPLTAAGILLLAAALPRWLREPARTGSSAGA